MADEFGGEQTTLNSPATSAAAVTPADDTDLGTTSRAIYVGVSGNVQLTTAGGQTVTLLGLAAGVMHPIRASRIWATDTTATDIVAFW